MSKDLKAISTATKEVEQSVTDVQQKVEELSKYVPNAHEWIKKYSIKELGKVYESIEYKLGSLKGKPLEEQLNILTHVVDNVLVKEEFGAQKYKQLEVFKQAYKQQLEIVQYKVDKQSTENILIKSKDFLDATKSKVVKKLGEELKELLDKDAPSLELKSKANALTKAIEKLEIAKEKKKFNANAYTQERKDNAIWDKGNGSLADKTLIDVASKNWKEATEMEKDLVYEYTHHYCNVNEPLQGRRYRNPQNRANFERKVDNITSYIDRNILPKDMWFTRGDDGLEVIASRIRFAGGKMPDNLEDLVGLTMQEGGFMSTGSRKGKGFSTKSVIMNIYAPKGTKAAYLEPISSFGKGAGRSWDGEERFSKFSDEHETLFQRGTLMRITKVYEVGDQTFIDCEVIGQEIKPLSYVKDKNIGY